VTTDQAAQLDGALEQVISAARAHLAAVRAADGATDDEDVWRSFVALNNASHTYDQLLLDEFGEVTPWETESIDVKAAEGAAAVALTGPDVPVGETAPDDSYPAVVSVRQRRDYRVPSLTALLAAAELAARRLALDQEVDPPETMVDAILELVRDGDGSLCGLDVPELEPLAGVLTVAEVARPLDLDGRDAPDTTDLFAIGEQDRLIGRLDEEPFTDLDDPDGDDPDGDDPPA
jgi:hypothetical protein